MEFLAALVGAIVVGLRAKQRGLNGLQWGGLAGALLFLTSAGIEFYRQAAGAPAWAWWIVAAIIMAALLAMLESKGQPVQPKQVGGQSADGGQTAKANEAAPAKPKGEKAGQVLGAVLVALVGAGWLWTSYTNRNEPDPAQSSSNTPAGSVQGTSGVQGSGLEVWDCVTAKNPGQLWRTIQFEPDNIYVYVGDETGTPSWGRYERMADGSLRMTVDEDERWVQWNVLERSGTAFTMANTFGLQVVCQTTGKRLSRPAVAPSGAATPRTDSATVNASAAVSGTEAGRKVVTDAFASLERVQAAIKAAEARAQRTDQCEGLLGMAKGSMGSVAQQLADDKAAAEAGGEPQVATLRDLTTFLTEMASGLQRECVQAGPSKAQGEAQPGDRELALIEEFFRTYAAARSSGNPACRAMAQRIQTYPDAISRSLDQARTMPSDEQKLMFIRSAARQAESGLGILRSQCN